MESQISSNMLSPNPPPAKVFLSYAHADEPLLNELRKHLSALRRQGVISTWHDRDITAGSEWAGQIAQELEEADVILLLISADFVNSDYCWDVEVKRAMQRHDLGEALIIPIFLRPCDWKGCIFGKLQGLPTDAKPVTGPAWSSHDEAFTIIATGIRAAIATWRKHAARLPKAPSRTTSEAQANPLYKVPKLLSSNFNAYAASRDFLTFLNLELMTRMRSLEEAGYAVDHSQYEGKVRFRVLTGDQTVYFFQVWVGGLGSDRCLSFFHGWGNRSISEGATTATATPVPDEYSGEVKLDVLNMSLLGHGSIQKVYTQDEFLSALWEEIVRIVDQLGNRR